jgi:hypothetical protein
MAAYRFRVTFEEHDEVSRDIEIKATQSFLDLHEAIQLAIGFDNKHEASFFMSNDNWKKGQEITNSSAGDPESINMKDAVVSNFITDPHQKIYLVYDHRWTFYIELVKIVASQPDVKYPVCVRSAGDAPKQYVIVEPPKGSQNNSEPTDEELMMITRVLEEDMDEDSSVPADDDESDEELPDDPMNEAIDEEEYDNIEYNSEENGEDDTR